MKWLLLLLISCETLFGAKFISSPQAFSAKELKQAELHNQLLNSTRGWSAPEPTGVKILRPFSEVEEAGYLLFHSDTSFASQNIKDTLAKNLPSGVKLLVYTNDSSLLPSLKQHYEGLAGTGRVETVAFSYESSGRAIWARDNTPVPVLLNETDSLGKTWAAVDAHYKGGDEPDFEIAKWFHINLIKSPYTFEGGNFVADARGNCVIVNNSVTAQIPSSIFLDLYGCQKLLRLPHIAGIGHADERVKFINDQIALTDLQSYVPQLEELGYQVKLLPRPIGGTARTYVNSLILNDRIFVPVFGEPNDKKALDIYESLGLKVFPINTQNISDIGLGSIHCITMTYPKMALESLRSMLFGE